jgi:Flp pilus assembly protein CpaB
MKLLDKRRARPTGTQRPESNGGRRLNVGRSLGRLDYRTRNLGLAILLGLLAVILTFAYVRSYKSNVESAAAAATVFVAARDISAGTAGSELVAGKALVARKVPTRDVVQGAISNRRQLAGLIASGRIYSGEQVTTRRFTTVAAAGIRGEVNGVTRALAVAGDAQQLLAGVLQPGDRVDVVMAVRYRTPGGDERVASRVILRNIRVLSAPESPAASAKIGGGATPGMQALLAVTDRQAQKLFIAIQHEWSLALRPFGRSADVPTTVDTSDGVLRGPAG